MLIKLFSIYDNRFLLALGLEYFQGFFCITMMSVSLMYIFKERFEIEPSAVQSLMAAVMLPWAAKIFYGMIIDSFPICGSRKRSYIVLMGILQCLAGITIGVFDELPLGPFFLMSLVIVASFAVQDTVIDAIMVQ